jgi:hypothetical protein
MSENFEPEAILDKIALCSIVIDQIKEEYEITPDPDQRADLLLAVEGLADNVARLVMDVRDKVWNHPKV